jgi:hypothetical protein
MHWQAMVRNEMQAKSPKRPGRRDRRRRSCAILYTEVVTLFAPAMFVPRTLYACLAVLRCIFAFSPGYIHPDEWFQHGEPLAGASPAHVPPDSAAEPAQATSSASRRTARGSSRRTRRSARWRACGSSARRSCSSRGRTPARRARRCSRCSG